MPPFLTRLRASLGAALVVLACSSPTSGQPPTPTRPPPSAGHSMVYADDLELVLLVNAGLGGMSQPPGAAPTKVWAWNGASWTVLDSAGPPVRNLAGVAWDSRRHTLVMHGGTYDQNTSYGETWEWTRQGGWRRFTGAGPGLRDHTQMAYDPERGRCVLFGGSGADPNGAFSDTWEFDGTKWERVATTGPPGLVHHAMAWDPSIHRVVVFGGVTPGVADRGDTWAWDGTSWTALPPATAPRTHMRMGFHGRLGRLLAVGSGHTGGSLVLALGPSGWAPLVLQGEPGARYLVDVAYDARRQVMVLFGGGDPAGMGLRDDTWEFDGATWRRP